MLSGRISERVPVCQHGTAMRDSAAEIRTDTAMKFALLLGNVIYSTLVII